MKPLNILFLSAYPLEHSANLAKDHIEVLESAGHTVDFNYPGMLDEYKPLGESLGYRIAKKLHVVGIANRLGYFFHSQRYMMWLRKGITMMNADDKLMQIDPNRIIEKASHKHYDLIMVLYFIDNITTETLRILSQHYKCPVIVASVDMGPMTGGCSYFGTCRNYADECRHCPFFNDSVFDYAHKNFLRKKYNYNSVDTVLFCNSYMRQFAEQTGLFKHIITTSILLNENTFDKVDDDVCRKEFSIAPEKKIIFLARYSKDPRKGFQYIIDGLNSLIGKYGDKAKNVILLLLIGDDKGLDDSEFHFDYKSLGFVNTETLVKCYSVSTAFLCPSTDDAGPSMVNQSQMVGTPVVTFNIGTSIDVVENGVSGFKCENKDGEGYTKNIEKIFTLFVDHPEDYQKLRFSSHEMAVKWNSPKTLIKNVEDVYNKFHKENKK